MCGTSVASPVCGLDFGRKDTFIGGRLRKSRSLQDLKGEIVLELPSDKVREATLRRRISSVEDLLTLAASPDENVGAMASLASQGDDHSRDRTAEATPREQSPAEQAPAPLRTEPCADPECGGGCGIRAVLGNALHVTTIAVETSTAGREPSKSEEIELPNGKAVAFQSAFFAASQRPPTPPAQPGVTHQAAKHPPSLLYSLKTDVPSSLIGRNISPTPSGASTPPRGSIDMSGVHSLVLDDRRNSCDLGHVAPSSGHLGQGSAAVELFYRLNHARQTVDYVKRQAAAFAPLNRATMGVWEALNLVNSLREYESALLGSESCDADMPLLEHALQTAEACRLEFPDQDWMALVGLIHGLGKLLAHATFGAEPQWAVCGESFPVGCRFHPAVVHSQYFQANPDRRRRAYATPTGVYQPGCGLSAVCMSWSGAEYLYMVLARNRTLLPPEALFLIRYQKFGALLRPGQPYGELLSQFDKAMLSKLSKFTELAAYRRKELPGRLEGQALQDHYDALMAKYIPQLKLRW